MNDLSESILWAHNCLRDCGHQEYDTPQVIRNVPWSTVHCFETSKGLFFLKSMASPFAIESTLLRFLFESVTQNIPFVIAENHKLQCFLMKDAGICLRGILKEKFDASYFGQIFKIYADIQIGCIPYVDKLIEIGVNDWRLKNLPALYQDFINQESLLKTDGITATEIEILKKLAPRFQFLCEELSDFCIPETIEHGDFHDNNILIKNRIITINDWGDASISHPFFSFVSFFNSARRHHNLNDSDDIYKNTREVFLSKWKDYGTENILVKALELAKTIRYFVFAFSFSRIKLCSNIDQYPEFNGYIAGALRDLIKEIID